MYYVEVVLLCGIVVVWRVTGAREFGASGLPSKWRRALKRRKAQINASQGSVTVVLSCKSQGKNVPAISLEPKVFALPKGKNEP